MTRARNGAAPAAPAGIWHDLPQPGDDDGDEPRGTGYRPPPTFLDGDERTVRTTSGDVCLAVYSDRSGWRVSEDDPSYGTDDEPSRSTDHATDVAAVLVESPRRIETRTEADMAERYDAIKLRLPRGYKARLGALCESEGQSASKLVATWIDGAERAERELAQAGGKGTK